MVHVKHLRSMKALLVNFQLDFQGPLPKWPFYPWLKKMGVILTGTALQVSPLPQHAITPLEPTHLPLFCWEGIPHPKKCASKNASTRNAQLRRQNPSVTTVLQNCRIAQPKDFILSSKVWKRTVGEVTSWWLSFNPFAKDAQVKNWIISPKFGVKI